MAAQFFRLTKTLIHYTKCGLFLINEEEEFQLGETDPPSIRGFTWAHELVEDGVIDWLMRQGTIRFFPLSASREKEYARLVVPLIVSGKGLGFLAVEGNFTARSLDQGKRDLMVQVGSVFGLALENQILKGTFGERLRRLDVLERVSQELALVTDLQRLLDFILNYALEIVPSEQAGLVWSDHDKGTLTIRCMGGHQKDRSEPHRDHLTQIERWVVDHGSPLVLNDYENDIRFREDGATFSFPLRHVLSTPMPSRNNSCGALSLFNRLGGQGYVNHDLVFLSTLASQAAVAIELATLYRDMKQGYKETIRALVNAIEAKDSYTRGHTERVTGYALQLADSLGIASEQREILEYASLLHDVGKIGIRGSVLRKHGPLTETEYLHIKRHPIIGEDIVRGVRFLDRARFLIRHHHERYDGRGYPDGLDGPSAPLLVHILILADALDAMSSSRPYRGALKPREVQRELLNNAGKQFHPEVVEQSLKIFFQPPSRQPPYPSSDTEKGNHEAPDNDASLETPFRGPSEP
jgi:hypothetical protein